MRIKDSEHSLEPSRKLGKLTEAVSENRRQFTSICAGMDTKFSDRIAMNEQKVGLLDDQLPPLRDPIGKGDLRLEGLVKAEARVRADKMLEQFEMLADKTVKLEKRHVENTRIQDTRVDEIAASVDCGGRRATPAMMAPSVSAALTARAASTQAESVPLALTTPRTPRTASRLDQTVEVQRAAVAAGWAWRVPRTLTVAPANATLRPASAAR